jgi:hypothetical protein
MSNGQTEADKFLQRLKERTKDLDAPVSNETVQAQLAAIQAWDRATPPRSGPSSILSWSSTAMTT